MATADELASRQEAERRRRELFAPKPRRVNDRDSQGRERRAVMLAPELWDWLELTAHHDGTSRSDLLEGLVLLAMDAAEAT